MPGGSAAGPASVASLSSSWWCRTLPRAASTPVTALPQAGSHPGPAQGTGGETQAGTWTAGLAHHLGEFTQRREGSLSSDKRGLAPHACTSRSPTPPSTQTCAFPAPTSPTGTGPDATRHHLHTAVARPGPRFLAHSAASFLGRAQLCSLNPTKPGLDQTLQEEQSLTLPSASQVPVC